MRYFLVHDGGLKDDSPYDNSYIIDKYKKGLEGGLGNLSSRVLRGKGWNVRQSVIRHEIPKDDLAKQHESVLRNLPLAVDEKMEQLNSRGAIQTILKFIYMVCNKPSNTFKLIAL